MTAPWPRLRLISLTFTGSGKEAAALAFSSGLNVLYGASNTGKSFAAKTIDFMLGGSTLPNFRERDGYEQAWLSLTLPKSGDSTLRRALAGGAFELLPGYVRTEAATGGETDAPTNVRKLAGRHSAGTTENISSFLLDELDLSGREIATDVHGKKRALSFRDLARFCLVDETAIQAETSPVESGQHTGGTTEHSVLKLLLTGQDDSKVVRMMDARTLKTTTNAKIEVIDEAVARIDEELAADYPHADQLPDQLSRLEDSWAEAQREAQAAQQSIRGKLATKNYLAKAIFAREQRRAEIQINFGRFEQLESVYQSDIRRLEAIEEAGFVLAVGGDRPCPLCGATAEDQKHSHGMADIKRARDAANAEIEKIRSQQGELRLTVDRLDTEGLSIERTLEELNTDLVSVERELADLAPAASSSKRRLDEVLAVRDHVRHGSTFSSNESSGLRARKTFSR